MAPPTAASEPNLTPEIARESGYDVFRLEPETDYPVPDKDPDQHAGIVSLRDRLARIEELFPSEQYPPFVEKTIYTKHSPDQLRNKSALSRDEITERMHIWRPAVEKVMYVAWKRSMALQSMRFADPDRKLDMPVTAMIIDTEGYEHTRVWWSNDNEKGNPSFHAEHHALNELSANLRIPVGQRNGLIAVVSQPPCYGCTGQIYMHHIEGVITGSQNNGVAGVSESYNNAKRTITEIGSDHVLNDRRAPGRGKYAPDWLLDFGLEDYQRALHYGLKRNPNMAEVAMRAAVDQLSLLEEIAAAEAAEAD
ncbi:MAG: hypothetical protein R3313_03410 [Candidatus Saccharimonadales bacterium]|nr:hypothetical protein [Candidatus Saccharimonadales bacterium]